MSKGRMSRARETTIRWERMGLVLLPAPHTISNTEDRQVEVAAGMAVGSWMMLSGTLRLA